MMVRASATGWLILSCGLGCGGNTSATKADATAGTSSTHTAGTSSISGAGTGSTHTGSTGGEASQPATCLGPEPICRRDCTSRDSTAAECVDFRYVCPFGWVDLDSCAAEACARRELSCCSPTGHVAFPECTADGAIGECPAGFEPKARCLPEGVPIDACSELVNGDACRSEEQVCYVGKCSRNCQCQPDAAGVLGWQCSALPC